MKPRTLNLSEKLKHKHRHAGKQDTTLSLGTGCEKCGFGSCWWQKCDEKGVRYLVGEMSPKPTVEKTVVTK